MDNSSAASVLLLQPLVTPDICSECSVQISLGKIDSIHHHLLQTISETATVLELKQKLLYTTSSEWWWWWWW